MAGGGAGGRPPAPGASASLCAGQRPALGSHAREVSVAQPTATCQRDCDPVTDLAQDLVDARGNVHEEHHGGHDVRHGRRVCLRASRLSTVATACSVRPVMVRAARWWGSAGRRRPSRAGRRARCRAESRCIRRPAGYRQHSVQCVRDALGVRPASFEGFGVEGVSRATGSPRANTARTSMPQLRSLRVRRQPTRPRRAPRHLPPRTRSRTQAPTPARG